MVQKIKALLFTNTSARQTVAKNAFWLSISNFGGRLLRAIIIVYAARVLGPTEWGAFNYAITVAAFLTIFVDLGMNAILIRERARSDSATERSTLTATVFWIKLILLALGMALIVFVAPRLPASDAFLAEKAFVLFPIIAFIVAFDTLREFSSSLIRSSERMEREAVSFLSTNAFLVLWGIFLLRIHPTVRGFTLAYALGTGMGAALALWMVRRDLRAILNGFSLRWTKTLLHSAWPFAISGALGMLMINTDIVMLGWFRSAEEIGFYAAPQRIIQIIYLIPSIISIAVLPIFSRLALHDPGKMRQIVERIVGAVFALALPITTGGILLAQGLIAFLFGAEFIPGTLSFQLLLLTLLADFSALILSNVVFAYNRQRNLIVYAAIGGFTNVGLNLLLIPRFGIAGCALATLIAQVTSNAYLRFVMRQINPIRVLPRLGNAILATVLMGLGVAALQAAGIHVVLSVIAGALIYGATLHIRREPLVGEILAIFRNPAPAPARESGA